MRAHVRTVAQRYRRPNGRAPAGTLHVRVRARGGPRTRFTSAGSGLVLVHGATPVPMWCAMHHADAAAACAVQSATGTV